MCKWHGGNTLAAKAKAQERLDMMVEKAITRLDVLVEQGTHLPTSLNAVKEVLDRSLGPTRGAKDSGDNRPLIQIGIGIGDHFKSDDVTIIDATRIDDDVAG